MAHNRLHQSHASYAPEQIENIFGTYRLIEPNKELNLAPVRRVAILTESFLPKVDGVSKTAYLTVRYLQQTGREVIVFAPDMAVSSVGPTEVVPLPSLPLPRTPETRMALPNPMVAWRIEQFKPDLIHLFSPAIMSVNGMAMGRHLNIPVVANYQTDLPGYFYQYGYDMFSRPMRNWLRYLHNGCHLTLVPTHGIEDEIRGWGYRRLRQWGRGVNIERFNPAQASPAMRKRLLNGRDPDALLAVYVGRLAHEKRVDLLVEVARTPGVALTIVGDGPLREELQERFAGTGTHFTGYMLGDELAQAFASADVFLFPGQNETFGQVVQEAMASGLPSVVLNQGGVVELVEDGRTGFICPPEPAAWAQAVITLRDNDVLRRSMSERARQIVEARPWSAIMAQLESHYREAIAINQRFKSLFGSTTYHYPFPNPIPAALNLWRG